MPIRWLKLNFNFQKNALCIFINVWVEHCAPPYTTGKQLWATKKTTVEGHRNALQIETGWGGLIGGSIAGCAVCVLWWLAPQRTQLKATWFTSICNAFLCPSTVLFFVAHSYIVSCKITQKIVFLFLHLFLLCQIGFVGASTFGIESFSDF